MAVVLVVDDEPDILRLMRINLESAGHRVFTAAGGVEALDVLRDAVPDAVFLVTAMLDDEQRFRGGIEGALRYITKPFEPDELGRALDPEELPEPEQRRRVQATALEALACAERGAPDDGSAPRVRLTRLEQAPTVAAARVALRDARERVKDLTPNQRGLLKLLADGSSVTGVAQRLGACRSNAYSGLRRIGRRVERKGINQLLAVLRQGELRGPRP